MATPKKIVPIHLGAVSIGKTSGNTQPIISKDPVKVSDILAATSSNVMVKTPFAKKHPNAIRGGGAVTGAGVGFAVGGPPGAIVGGIVGLIAGDFATNNWPVRSGHG